MEEIAYKTNEEVMTVTVDKKAAARERMANARASKKRPRRSKDIELARLKEQVKELKAKLIIPVTETSAPGELPKPKIESAIKWFTEVDLNDKGKVASDYPAWYFDVHVKELAEDIRSLENGIDEGIYIGKKRRDAVKQLETKKQRYSQIVDGKPKMTDVNKDKVMRSFKELGGKIGESMFSHDDMWKMTADAHAEAERMVMPCIAVTDEVAGSFVKERGMKVVDGKISRNDASIVWKCMAKALGEQTDVEALRRVK